MKQIVDLLVPNIDSVVLPDTSGLNEVEIALLPTQFAPGYEIHVELGDDNSITYTEYENPNLTFVNNLPSGITTPSGFITSSSGWISISSVISGNGYYPTWPGISGGPYASGVPFLLGYTGTIFSTSDVNNFSISGYYIYKTGLLELDAPPEEP